MSVLRLFAIMFIFGVATIAWCILGGAMHYRTSQSDSEFSNELENLWGPEMLVQTAPYWSPTESEHKSDQLVSPSASRITADIKHEYRDKGLLWYSIFTVDFCGRYTIPAADNDQSPADGFFIFDLPDHIQSHDGLRLVIDDQEVILPSSVRSAGNIRLPVNRADEHVIEVSFETYGRDTWVYCPGEPNYESGGFRSDSNISSNRLMELQHFSLTISTDFKEIDYPKGTRSPSTKAEQNNGGMKATWKYDSCVTNQSMGVVMPKRLNAGPIAARMSFFAPVSLLFFFTALFAVVVIKKIPLHPMHYLFISGGFFAFHILMAYMVDIVSIHVAFWTCAAVSVLLVVSYMRLVAGVKFAITFVAIAQTIYLVGFSYAFFWEGKTGLIVTIGGIMTLFVIMQATGRFNWSEAFKGKAPPPLPYPPQQSVPDQENE